MKKLALALSSAMIFFAVQEVQAFDPEGGNALWGKYAIQTCRSCHKEKGLSGLDPNERPSEAWAEIFVDNYAKLREMDHDFAAVGINDRQLENIHRYLVETAVSAMGTASITKSTPKKTTSYTRKSTATTATVTSSMTSGAKFDMAAGSAGKGRYIFRKCLSCHKKNKAPTISPGDRTKKAWDRYFARDYKKFKKAMPEFDTYKYSTSQMQHLHQFMVKYALDADKPKTCE